MDSRDLAKNALIWALAVVTGLMVVTPGGKAYARSGAGRAVYSDPLCNNPKMTGARRDGCAAILAQLTESSSCTKPILDRIAAAAARGQFGGMNAFCPNYSQFNGDSHARALIWRNIVAALVTEESSWNPRTSGDGGRSRGLLQFGHSNARMKPYSCACQPAQRNIENASANARCGTHIFLYNVARDMKMGGGPAGYPGSYGAARFFGPYGDRQSNKRARMAAKVTQYCRSLPTPAKPQPTPAPVTPAQPSLVISENTGGGGAISERTVILPPVQKPRAAPPQFRSQQLGSSGFMFAFE